MLLSDAMPRMKPFRQVRGEEEGDRCGRNGCKGTLELPEVENCSCHIAPPCGPCVDTKLTCTECGREVEEG